MIRPPLAYILTGIGLLALAIPLIAWQPQIARIIVAPGGDAVLTATSPADGGVTTLTTANVTTFHLTQDSTTNGHVVRNIPDPSTAGDALSAGTAVSSNDFQGTLPNPTLVHKPFNGTATWPGQVIAAPTCREEVSTVTGALAGQVIMITPAAPPEPGVVVTARVTSPNVVAVRTCVTKATFVASNSFALTFLP